MDGYPPYGGGPGGYHGSYGSPGMSLIIHDLDNLQAGKRLRQTWLYILTEPDLFPQLDQSPFPSKY